MRLEFIILAFNICGLDLNPLRGELLISGFSYRYSSFHFSLKLTFIGKNLAANWNCHLLLLLLCLLLLLLSLLLLLLLLSLIYSLMRLKLHSMYLCRNGSMDTWCFSKCSIKRSRSMLRGLVALRSRLPIDDTASLIVSSSDHFRLFFLSRISNRFLCALEVNTKNIW